MLHIHREVDGGKEPATSAIRGHVCLTIGGTGIVMLGSS